MHVMHLVCPPSAWASGDPPHGCTAALVFPVVGILTRATGAGRGGCRCPQSRAEAGRAIAEGAGPPLAAPDGLVVAVRPTRACDWLLKWARAADVPLLS